MAGDFSNHNIFAGAPGRFLDALPLFSGAGELCLPVRREAAGAAVMEELSDFQAQGRRALAAYTSPALLNPPFIASGLEEAALLFFHAPNHENFVFNAAHPQALAGCAPLDASRRDMSLLAGFARLGGAAPAGDTASRGAGELALGNLHAAHYLLALGAARNPASRARFQMCSALVELGLMQEAYDELKADWDPEARLLLAVILRRTGGNAEARKQLEALGQVAAIAERREVENAWLDLEEGKEEEALRSFQRLSASAFDKAEALAGLGAALSRAAFKSRDKGRLSAAASALRSALATPSPAALRILLQLGSISFRTGDYAQAESCYRRCAAQAPSVQALANLALTLVKTGKLEEAAAITRRVCLTDPESAKRLAAEFPPDRLAALFPPPAAQQPAPPPRAPQSPSQVDRFNQAAPQPPQQAPQQAQTERYVPPPAAGPQTQQPAVPPAFRQGQPSRPGGLDAAGSGFQFIKPGQAPLQPAQPVSVSGRSFGSQQPPQAPPVQIETMRDVMSGAAQPTEEESRRDDFISRAFKLASDLEDELGRKVYFNADGLAEAERRLRMQFLKGKANPQGNLETVKNCSAFLCYFLQERFKGRLLKLEDFDPWGWPMLFELPGNKVLTYPVQRVWRLLWEENLPEPGWLGKYAQWLADRLKEPPALAGAEAARALVQSHPERLADAQTEHRRMLVLIASLQETSHIEIGRTGLMKLEAGLKQNFRPSVPPTTDGWKLLRCYGHLLAAILARDFKASWYNTDGEDGGWSMVLPWKTLVFPIGKIYKTASGRDDLDAYYEALLAEKLRYQ